MALPSCEQYDEIAMWNKNESMDARLRDLEELCDRMNTNISSLQVIVDALQKNDYVTAVSPVVEAGDTIGYTLDFSQSGAVTIYHGENGADGSDGNTPSISARRDTDGLYYWTIDGEWMKDEKGDKVPAQGERGPQGAPGEDGSDGDDGAPGKDGVTPKLRIGDDGYWYVSYDKGATWEKLGLATGTPGTSGDSMFESVTVNDDHIVLVLTADGSEIKLPLHEAGFSFEIDETTVTCAAGGSAEVGYTLTPDDATIQIESVSHSPYQVTIDRTAKKIRITLPAGETPSEESEILLFASDDNTTLMRKITVKTLQLNYFRYKATERLDGRKPMNETENPDERLEDYYFFGGRNMERLPEYDTYDPNTGEGGLAYTGTATWIWDSGLSNNPIYEDHLIEITIPATITELGHGGTGSAFHNCKSLEKVIFEGDGITLLNNNTFADCWSLKEISLPKNIEKIEYNAFLRCEALEEIVIPDKTQTIEKQVFSQCSSLKHVTLGAGVKSIGNHAFNECDALEWILCDIETPPTLEGEPFPVSGGWNEVNYKIYVPDDQVDEYKKAWPDYWDDSGWYPTKVIYPISDKQD